VSIRSTIETAIAAGQQHRVAEIATAAGQQHHIADRSRRMDGQPGSGGGAVGSDSTDEA
jgi:hypothetical protein